MSDRPTEQQPDDDSRSVPADEPVAAPATPPPAAAAPSAAAPPPTRRWTSGPAAAVAAAAAALVFGGVSGFGLGFLFGHHGLRHDRAPLVRLDPEGDRFSDWRDWRGPVPDRPRWAQPEESESPSPSSSAL